MNHNLVKTFFKAYPIIYKLVWKENLLLSFIDIFHGMSFAIIVIMTQKFFDVIASFLNGNLDKSDLIILSVLLIVCQILTQILNGFVNFYADVVKEKGYGKICHIIQRKLINIAPIEFEKNAFLDDINKADQGAIQACDMVDTINSIFTFYVPYFTVIAIYMYKLNFVLVLAIVFVFVPVFISNFVRLHFGDVIENEIAPIRRESEAYEKVLITLDFYKENRVLGAANTFIKLYKDGVDKLNGITWKKRKKEAIINIGLSMLSFIAYGAVLVMLVYLCMKGDITIGSFAAVFASIDVMFYLMDEIFQDSLGRVAKNMGLINNFLNLMNHSEVDCESIDVQKNDICLKNIYFKYPESEKVALNNLSMYIKENETVAIVGENGAGKSTLARIILGIYTPNRGEIEIGGIKIDEKHKAFRYISSVFQKFNRYKLDVCENVILSDFNEEKKYSESLKLVDDKLNIETGVILSRDFDGIDLSGGQWQKLAIARGVHKKAKILVLDEPTAAIDPIQESEMYNRFIKISENKTSIIITHRLGIARAADRIFVLKEGEIVESGTHQDLLAQKGEYYLMWTSQADWYQK